MNIKLQVAKIYLPPQLKHKGLLNMYCNLAEFLHSELHSHTPHLTHAFQTACTEVGKASARTLKEELNLENTFEDAVNAWIIGSKAMNVTLSIERKGHDVVFNHIQCPMWENFKNHGTILCEQICIPVAESMAKEIYPEVEMIILRSPDMDHTCIKALKAPC
ncbi:MAG: hypothetical protein HXS47_08275 [Theionarchaea archaeon]|nr:hypothetical protein [Theionarchaea archaeon]